MVKVRPLGERLPSATELDDFQACPFKWFMRWRQGVSRTEDGIYLMAGAAASDAVERFYCPKSRVEWEGFTPIELFDNIMTGNLQKNPNIDSEEFTKVWGLYRDALNLYFSERKTLWDDWVEVLGAQIWINSPSKMKLDLVVRKCAGNIAVIEQKVISSFADLTYENQKYEMGYQPLSYSEGASRHYGEEVNEVVIDYIVRGSAARGRYKAIPPRLDTHVVYVEPWKKEMWLRSACFINECMEAIDKEMEKGEVPMIHIPRFTRNCMIKLGMNTYPCDYYPACSVNMHPKEVTGIFKWGEVND